LRVLVTGAAGQIAYSLLPLLASGQVFGADQPIILQLLDIPPAETALHGVVMEIEDGAYPLVKEIIHGSDAEKIFKDTQVAIFLGGFPRKEGMERKELISKNIAIFKQQGEILNSHAHPNCKVLVVANPANTNCLALSKYAPNIPKKNFSALTRLDMNRALSQLSLKSKADIATIKNVIIWGNHSSTQYPDVSHGTIGGKSVIETLGDSEFLHGNFITKVQKRGAAIIAARKLSSAMSAANAVKDHLKDWFSGTKEGEFVSMAVLNVGKAYGLPEDLCFSFPVKCHNFEYEIVHGLEWSEFSKNKIEITTKELEEERKEALEQ